MLTSNSVAIPLAAIVSFVAGGLWYSPLLFGDAYLTLRGLDLQAGAQMTVGELLAEFARCLIISAVVAHFVRRLGITTLASAAIFSLWVWVVIFAVVAGSIVHEGYPWRLYAIHAGDGLTKLLLISAIVAWWAPR